MSTTTTRASGQTKPVVVTTFTVLADMAQNVAGDHFEVVSITKPGAEIHGYEPTPQDITRASRADLILDNGLNLEAWFAQFVEGIDVPHVVVSRGVQTRDITGGTAGGQPNPHAWMSAVNAQIYVDNIVAAFIELSPEHEVEFRANAEEYKSSIQAIHQSFVDSLAEIPATERALVTCEGAFSYLAHDAGLTENYLWPVNSEQQATPQQVKSVIEFVRTNDVTAVFCESTVSAKAMHQVAAEGGAGFGGTLYVDSLSNADGPVPTYLDLIGHNAETISAALTRSRS